MGANYLVRITDICSELATKLIVAAPRGENEHGQFRIASRNDKNVLEHKGNYASPRQARALREQSGQAESSREAQRIEAESAGDGFESAAFVRELDSLRLRMMGASFYERVREMSHQIVGAAEIGAEFGPEQVSDNDQSLKSIREAVTSAVLLLSYNDMNAGRTR